ncbi:PstS family phosphate ABC transporter substrate-binding protein [Sphingobacterium sp. BIGb0165]|uniref:PstS family phosphate ABC transporter substrate-binding protein n=1 Tax=Sphingobacterium sp. BIGb0165 TaxID=2940615 RepID=UPI002167C845|nr:substrate-binding domain-containing protein [Sphingobacterium sp. BIGb0165]MCS4224762.1 phosphate transport system substrate-binding protein [Sphingobacterium sp. BIGb0165]
MRKYSVILVMFSLSVGLLLSCKDRAKSNKGSEDILTGKLPVLVDQTLLPIIKESADVFESSYPNSSLEIMARPEIKAVNALLSDSAYVIVLTRKLNSQEDDYFKKRGIQPKIFQMASDAVVLINNRSSTDTIMSQNNVKSLLEGNLSGQRLIFDNANSSTLRFLKDNFKIDKIDPKAVSAMRDSEDVMKYISENANAVGVIGYNWYLKAVEKNSQLLDKIRTLSIENVSAGADKAHFYKPSQSTIADGVYPFIRPVYIMNYQPNMGLGLGFSAFLTGDRGQRIVLKAGLVPVTMPGREIIIRDESYIK